MHIRYCAYNFFVGWQQKAACKNTNTELFYPKGLRVGSRRAMLAKQICGGCPVIRECYEAAVERGEEYGVWGGTNFLEFNTTEMRGNNRPK